MNEIKIFINNIPISKIFIEESYYIKSILEEHESTEDIVLKSKYSINKYIMLIDSLLISFSDKVLDIYNKDDIEEIINIIEYYDIKKIEEPLKKYFAEKIIPNIKNISELYNLYPDTHDISETPDNNFMKRFKRLFFCIY